MKRILALMLALLMLIPLAACSSDKPSTPADTSSGTGTPSDPGTAAPDTEPAETEPEFDPGWVDDLPKDLNFGGASVTFAGLKDMRMTMEEDSADRYESAVYERQLYVAERLNVKIEEVFTSLANWTAAVRANDDTYQYCSTRSVYIYEYSAEGLAYLWTDLDYLDFTKDYWFDYINEKLTVGNRVVTAVSAANINSYANTTVILFNKKLIEDYALEDPYELVRSGKWTWDKFAEFGHKATFDLNGDGAMTKDDDAWGYYGQGRQVVQDLIISAGQLLVYKDADDIPYFDLDMNEEFINVLDRAIKMMYDGDPFWKHWDDGDISESGVAALQENRALMLDCTFYSIDKMREMDADFGVLPYPKYSEDQQAYDCRILDLALSMFPSPASLESVNRMAAVLEAMSSYAIRYTIPEYYEIRLKTKYARDQESGEMFDIIMSNRVFDLGVAIAKEPERAVREIFVDKNNHTKIVSRLSGKADAIIEAMDAIVDGILNMQSVH